MTAVYSCKDIAQALEEPLKKLCQRKGRVLLAIDGRCASGKSTLALYLQQLWGDGAVVLPMDDFFLRPEQRLPARLSLPGGNLDIERLIPEALAPLQAGKAFSYRAFDCHTQQLRLPARIVPASSLAIAEGSYSCHPALRRYYDLRVFLSVNPQRQAERLRARGGEETAAVFARRWIPLEERYFSAFSVERFCDFSFNT